MSLEKIMLEKEKIEKYLNDKALEIGEYLLSEGLDVDVFIIIEKDGLEYTEGNYLSTN